MDDDAFDALLETSLNETLANRINVEYDGVLGLPPNWVPVWRMQEYQQARSRLLEKYDHSKIVNWLGAHDMNSRAIGEYKLQIFVPLDAYRDISLLALIRQAVLLGKDEGLPILIGDEEAKNLGVAEKVANGYAHRESYKHKIEFQGLAKRNKDNFSTIEGLRKIKEFDFYFQHYGKGHTLRDWINEVMPGHLKRGRPPKK